MEKSEQERREDRGKEEGQGGKRLKHEGGQRYGRGVLRRDVSEKSQTGGRVGRGTEDRRVG